MPTLDLATNTIDKTKFFNRVRSKIIEQALEGVFDQASWNKIMTIEDCFSWTDDNGDTYYNGVILLFLVMDTVNPTTKVSMQNLRNKIAKANSALFQHDIPEMLKYIKNQYDLIMEMGETHDNLLINTFDAILSALNTQFIMFFSQEKMRWEAGKVHTFKSLSEIAKSICNNMVTNNKWDAVYPKDA